MFSLTCSLVALLIYESILHQINQHPTFAQNYLLFMAYTESIMLPLGTVAPAFSLPDFNDGGTIKSLSEVAGSKATVVMFLCNHCPYVLYVNPEIVKIVAEYSPKGVSFVGINSNDPISHPEDAPKRMSEHAREVGYTFPYFFDATQEVARAYEAACTPDFFVFDEKMQLVYRGQLDASRPKRNPIPSDGADLRAALNAVLSHLPPLDAQRPSGGCNIKWK